MTGIIWFVQLVHYPLFSQVGSEKFVAYENAHTKLTAITVGPPMLVEGLTALALTPLLFPDLHWAFSIANLLLLAATHASTVLLQVPLHSLLSKKYDENNIKRLVITNSIRTGLWSARSLLIAAVIIQQLP